MASGAQAAPAPIDFNPADPAPGNMRFAWIHGSISAKHNTDPRVQVHRYNEHTYILRQNPAVHWEAPFMYLLIGERNALLIDAGATEEAEYFPLRSRVEGVLARWATAQAKPVPHLTIMLSGDAPAQTAGLAQFVNREDTTVITADRLADSPRVVMQEDGNAILDLGGGRTLTLLPTPGVSPTGLSAYDPYTDFLFTGTTLLPGRIVIRDFFAYTQSLDKLTTFSAEYPVKWLMGAHIDMSTTPGVDYRLRSNYRPREHALELPASALADCRAVVTLINGREWVEALPDLIVMHGVGRGERPYGYPVYTPALMQRHWLR